MDSFPDSSEDVLNDLDPLSRALLDLSVQRGMDDAEIAQVLGTDEDSVFEVRVGLLRNLAEKVAPEHAEDDLPELQAAVSERLYPEDDAAEEADTPAEPEPLPEPDPAPDTVARPEPPHEERKRRSPLVYILPLLLLVAVAFLIASGIGGESDGELSEGSVPKQKTEQAKTVDEGKPVRLTGLGSGEAAGTAGLDGNRLTLTLRDLPAPGDGVYTVWLYNSVIDAKQLKTVKGSKVTATLPADARKYEFVDVSVEPRDGNANHSGQSVLRVPLKKLQT